MTYNMTPATPNIFGLFDTVNTGTGEYLALFILILIYLVIYISAVRAYSLNPFFPASAVGFIVAIFLWMMQWLHAAYVVITLILFVIAVGLSWGRTE